MTHSHKPNIQEPYKQSKPNQTKPNDAFVPENENETASRRIKLTKYNI